MPRPDFIGKRFNRLVVLSLAKGGHRECVCDCGTVRTIPLHRLISGHTKSCGCLRSELVSAKNTTHGLHGTPTYMIWKGMRNRCNNINEPAYSRYGGRGITVCERWNNYVSFLADMGERLTTKHSIDRIDNNGDYTPDNCKWSTMTEQANNTRANLNVTFNNQALTLTQWARKTGMNYDALRSRIFRKNWPIDLALTTPIGKQGKRHG